MARIERRTRWYPSDLTDEEWARIGPLSPRRSAAGRPRRTDPREVLNAPRYLVRTGRGWRMPPKDLPPWQTVYRWFRRLFRLMLFATIHDLAPMLDRRRARRTEALSAGMLDSRTEEAPEAGAERGGMARGAWSTQAAHRGGCRRTASDGEPDARRHLRQRGREGGAARIAGQVALDEDPVRRQRL